jgi:predicted alpha/beta superfamily hydrolase
MWRLLRGLILLVFLSFPALSQERYIVEKFPSRNLGERTVRIYLPATYYTSAHANYPVLYLHDGQNVFSFAGTNVAFGWGSWELDRTADRLAAEGKMQEIIMVAVDNSPARIPEYRGTHHSETNELTNYEKYEAFLIKELKPAIDGRYRTRREPPYTAVMGSSMGGLCSIVLAWEHPDVFGGAASLSGAFMMNTNFVDSTLRSYKGSLKDLRLYVDCGSIDFMGGDDGRTLTTEVAKQFRRIGYQDCLPDSRGKGPLQRKSAVMLFIDEKPLSPDELEKTGLRRDKWKEAGTSQHNEFYWRLRAWRPLEFLFPPLVP